jgi:L-iditol 2-dehydrogenase
MMYPVLYMKAILYQHGKGASLREVPAPSIGSGEALIAVDACGLCGTDIMKLATQAPSAVLGHELAGRIAKIGPGVKDFREGDRVVVSHHVPCLDCHYCRKGSFSMCRQFKATNIDPGGFAEYVRVPEPHVRHTMLKIPEKLDALSASQTEPLSCCLRNAKRLALRAGDTVGLIGLGAIGMMTAQLLRHLGVAVLGLDLDAARAAALSPWGQGFTEAAAMEAALRRATSGRGLDALIFTAGPPSQAAGLLGWIRDGGILNIFASFHPESKMSLDLNEVYHRELTIVSSYSPSLEDLRQSLDLIASGAVPVAALSPKVYPLESFETALDDLRGRRTLKAIFQPAAAQ